MEPRRVEHSWLRRIAADPIGVASAWAFVRSKDSNQLDITRDQHRDRICLERHPIPTGSVAFSLGGMILLLERSGQALAEWCWRKSEIWSCRTARKSSFRAGGSSHYCRTLDDTQKRHLQF
jgi:hypothetical protein